MIAMMPPDNKIRGRILVTLMGECKSTEQIAYELAENLSYIRSQLVRMHHLGLVYPVAIRIRDGDRDNPGIGYFQDLIWELTRHTRDHNELVSGCYGCLIRESFIANEAFYE